MKNSTKTFDVVFNDDIDSNCKGFEQDAADCYTWIQNNKNSDINFKDYATGTVTIVCNESGETIQEIDIATL